MLRRMAVRFVRIVRRRAPGSPAVEAFLRFALLSVEDFIAVYDKAMKSHARWRDQMVEGSNAVLALHRQIKTWVPIAKRDLNDLDGTEFGNQPDMPDHLIAEGERLAGLVANHRDSRGNPLPYQEAALGALTPSLEAAARKWAEAKAADARHQKLLVTLQHLAHYTQEQVELLRRTLFSVGGRLDGDYQQLRPENVGPPAPYNHPKTFRPSLGVKSSPGPADMSLRVRRAKIDTPASPLIGAR
jgi:hypothetical protein